jgi:hypothetical protein
VVRAPFYPLPLTLTSVETRQPLDAPALTAI